MRILLSASVLACVATAGTAAVASSAPTAAALPRCHTAGLAGHLGSVSAGAGQRDVRLTLRNTTSHTCRTQGWVGMQLVGRHGRHVRTNAVRVSPPSSRVVLHPGQRARTTLRWTALPSPGEPQSGACEPTARRLRVTPPDETATLSVRWRGGPVCGFGRIEVRPLRHA
jgi:hypothetical protein